MFIKIFSYFFRKHSLQLSRSNFPLQLSRTTTPVSSSNRGLHSLSVHPVLRHKTTQNINTSVRVRQFPNHQTVYVKHTERQTLLTSTIIRYRHSCAHDAGIWGSADLTSANGVFPRKAPWPHRKSASTRTSQNSRIALENDDDYEDNNNNNNNSLGFTTYLQGCAC